MQYRQVSGCAPQEGLDDFAGGFFRPSDRALEFGDQYARVLACWAGLFTAASALVEANVVLGRMTSEAGKEFDQWMSAASSGPLGWLNPDALRRFMEGMPGKPPAPGT